MFSGLFFVHGRLNGPSDLQRQVKVKNMKLPSDIPMPRFEHGGSDLLSNTPPLDHGGARGNMETS